MARKTLEYAITGDERDLRRALKSVDKHLGDSGKAASKFGSVLGGAFKGAGYAAAAGVGALAVESVRAVKAFQEANKISKQTAAVLKSTGGVAKVTADEVNNLATALSRKTGIDDQAIQSGENLLLTFTNIRNEVGKGNNIFDRATKTIVDMSAALGQDTKSSALQLGKALNDPIKGVTALQRVGVSFTTQQKDQIKTLVDSGKTLDAQKMILRELNKEFGGSAEAQATASDKMKVAVGSLEESFGQALTPAVEAASEEILEFADRVQPRLQETADQIAAIFDSNLSMGDKFSRSGDAIVENFRPLTRKLKREFEAAFDGSDLGPKVEQALDKAGPAVLDKFALFGAKAAQRFARAFIEADPLTRAIAALIAAQKFGLFTGMGRRAGAAMGQGAATTAGAGTAGGLVAGSRGVRGLAGGAAAAFGGPIGVAAGLGLIFGPELIKSGKSDLQKELRGVAKGEQEKINREFETGRMTLAEYTRALGKLRDEYLAYARTSKGEAHDAFKGIADDINNGIEASEKFADAINRMATNGGSDLDSIRTNTRITAKAIRRDLGGTDEGTRLLIENFQAAASAIDKAMADGKVSMRDGSKAIRKYLRDIAEEAGMTAEQTENYLSGIGSFGEREPGSNGGSGRPGVTNRDRRGSSKSRLSPKTRNKRAGAPGPSARVSARMSGAPRATASVSSSAIVPLGRWIQSQGYQVAEHPSFGGVGGHTAGSLHYSGQALDVNADGASDGEGAALDRLAAKLTAAGWHVLWRVPDHYNHLHVDTANGVGRIPSGTVTNSSGTPSRFRKTQNTLTGSKKPISSGLAGEGPRARLRMENYASMVDAEGENFLANAELSGNPDQMAAALFGIVGTAQMRIGAIDTALMSKSLAPKKRADLLTERAGLVRDIARYGADLKANVTPSSPDADPSVLLAQQNQILAQQLAEAQKANAIGEAQLRSLGSSYADVLSGQIGGRVGLSGQAAGVPGSLART